MNKLTKFLDTLNRKLTKKGIKAELTICGAYAIELHGFKRDEITNDIDSVTSIPDQVKDLILEVSREFSNGEKLWLNSQVSDVTMPKGYQDRLVEINHYSNIKIKVLSIEDLILLKVNAWLSRGEYTSKDFNDLVILGANEEQINKGIDFIKSTKEFSDLPHSFQLKSLELLSELKKHFRK